MTPITRVVRGDWKPAANEILKPSVTTKMCFIVALALSVLDTTIADLVRIVQESHNPYVQKINFNALTLILQHSVIMIAMLFRAT